MLSITIPASPERDLWDAQNEVFIHIPPHEETTIRLEHSLVSMSKWESKWHKPFWSKEEKTEEEIIDYIRCMTLTQNVNPMVYLDLSTDNIKQINAYIDNPMTATTFKQRGGGKPNRDIITSEVLYYYMFTYNIPVELEKWHLNRLVTLIRVFAAKNEPAKKMSKNEILRNNAALNAERRKKYNSKG